jgi:group I intron endonuclease
MEEKIGIIYMYVSPSGKVYIGQTLRERKRKFEHKSETIKTKTYFGNALRKYGYDSFEYWVLFKFKTTKIDKLKRALNWLEKKCIDFYKSDVPEFGYNLNKGGDGNIGYKHTEETKEYLKTIPKSERQLNNLELGRKGRINSEETRLKMSNSHNKTKKKVEKYDLEDNLLETFNSIEDAARSIEGRIQKTKANKISACCNNYTGVKTTYGYVWRFIEN